MVNGHNPGSALCLELTNVSSQMAEQSNTESDEYAHIQAMSPFPAGTERICTHRFFFFTVCFLQNFYRLGKMCSQRLLNDCTWDVGAYHFLSVRHLFSS